MAVPIIRFALRAFLVIVAGVWFTAAADGILHARTFVMIPQRMFFLPSKIYALWGDVVVSKSPLSATEWAIFASDIIGIVLLFSGASAALALAMSPRLGQCLK